MSKFVLAEVPMWIWDCGADYLCYGTTICFLTPASLHSRTGLRPSVLKSTEVAETNVKDSVGLSIWLFVLLLLNLTRLYSDFPNLPLSIQLVPSSFFLLPSSLLPFLSSFHPLLFPFLFPTVFLSLSYKPSSPHQLLQPHWLPFLQGSYYIV